MKLKKLLCLMLSIIMLLGASATTIVCAENLHSIENGQQIEENDIYDVISCGIASAEGYLTEKLTEIHNDSGVTFGSDWAIITMLRGGKSVDSEILEEYIDSLKETVSGWGANVKPTDVAKVVLALSVMGEDVCDFEGVNLIELICNSERLESGTNELAYSLIAIYASGAQVPQDAVWDINAIIEKILTFQREDGGFGLFDTETADVDMTAICVQALAPYMDDDAVSFALDNAISFLADSISDDWNYDENPNTTAQVLLALSSVGIDVSDPENGFGINEEENIVTSLEMFRNTEGNGYLYGDSVNTMATYQVMQAYDGYRKVHIDEVLYWDFGTDGQEYDDIGNTQEPDVEENEADPVDVFVTIVDNGEIVTDKNGSFVAQKKVTVSDLDKDGVLTVNEALYATHEELYDGGASSGYSTFFGDYGLSLAILWGRGTEGVSASSGYYLNNASCWSLNDVVDEGDYLTAFNYYDASYYSDSYSYFNKNSVSVKQGNSASLTLYALGYDEFWNQIASPYADAKVRILGTDDVFTTNSNGKVKIPASGLEPGTYYAVAYTDAKNIVPAVCEITVTEKTSSGGGSNVPKKLNIAVKVMVHGEDCNNRFTYANNSSEFDAMVSVNVTIDKGETVYDALLLALGKEGIDFTESNGYVSEIGGYGEFDHGPRSGWMFTVDGVHENTGCKDTKLVKDSTVLWYYTDDYTNERSSHEDSEDFSKDEITRFGLFGKHDDISYRNVINKGKTFSDIVDCEGKMEIEALCERGIINGKTEECYEPYETMTRAEFATIVVNALGLPLKDGITFSDVDDNQWYAPYIKTAYFYGIVKGVSQNQFNPQGTITTEEAAAMVERAAKLCGIDNNVDTLTAKYILENYDDFNEISAWAFTSLGFCIKEEILNDSSDTISPKKNVTREDVAVMIYRMLGKAKLL